MAWMTTEEKIAALKLWRVNHPESKVSERECPSCGWDASSHGESQYGLDCPWGTSPAAKDGRLGPRVVPA